MKFSSALVTAAAPLALAKSVQKSPPSRRGVGAIGNVLPALVEPVVETETIIILWSNVGGGAPTQVINPQASLTQAATASVAAGGGGGSATAAAPGATHTVNVGGDAGLQFVPDSVVAATGDIILFNFLSQNHSATQSAFASPCEAMAGGMDSGFMPNANNTVNPAPQVAMQVMTTTPLWFFCKQTGHCGKGMTFSVNPTANKTQAMFQQMAIAQNGTGGSSAITGGSAPPAAPPAASSSLAALQPLGSASAAAGALASTTAPSAAGGTGLVTGTGSLDSTGACTCHVTCDMTGQFPAVQAQGLNAFGGTPGSIPASMAEAS